MVMLDFRVEHHLFVILLNHTLILQVRKNRAVYEFR